VRKAAGAESATVTSPTDLETKEEGDELVNFCEENADNTAACVNKIRESGIVIKKLV